MLAIWSVAAPLGATPDDESLLKAQTQALLDAIAPGDRAVWARYLHADFIHLDENGIQRDQRQLIEEISPLPAGLVGRIVIDRFSVRFHGTTAVTAYEVQEHLDYHGQQLRSRFRAMDTWLRTADGWRFVGGHTAAVLKDPPAFRLSLTALCDYEGIYHLTPAIEASVRVGDDGALRIERTGRPPAAYRPELRDIFFAAGQPRTRRIFLRDEGGAITGFADRREGEDVVWRRNRSHEGASDQCRTGTRP
ncbi:MAG: nuclear transport factor 2 family protein [Sphingosinicella sp.]